MANHLDLEEQEQLDQLKHFWNKYGNLITWLLIAVFGTIAAFNGWSWWQRNQATQASALYDEIDRASKGGDMARVERAFNDVKDKYGRSTYAQQAGLLTAHSFANLGKNDQAKEALTWVADKSSDEGLAAIARLRLAGLLIDAKAYDDALKQLAASGYPKEFQALAADRRGDVLLLQGRKAEAKAEFQEAWKGMDERTEYRRLVEVKLASLGADPRAAAAPAAGAASGAAKS